MVAKKGGFREFRWGAGAHRNAFLEHGANGRFMEAVTVLKNALCPGEEHSPASRCSALEDLEELLCGRHMLPTENALHKLCEADYWINHSGASGLKVSLWDPNVIPFENVSRVQEAFRDVDLFLLHGRDAAEFCWEEQGADVVDLPVQKSA